MKITLDGKALEALIGGNTEVEVELRNCVVQEFAKKHLKAVANSETFEIARKAAILGAQQEIAKTVGTITGWPQKVILTSRIEEAIQKAVYAEYSSLISSKLQEMRQEIFDRIEAYKQEFDKLVESKIDKDIQQIVDYKVGQKLNYVINNVK